MSVQCFFTSRIGIILTASFVCFLWGSSFPMIKIAYHSLELTDSDIYKQILFAGYRFLLASLFLLMFLYIKQKNIRFIKGSLPAIIQVGFFQTALQYLMLHVGVSLSTGIESSIITGSTTFFSIIIAHYMYVNDRLNWQKTIGLTLGFIGVILATGNGSLNITFSVGAIALLIAAISNAFGGVLAKKKGSTLPPVYLTAYQMLVGSFVLLTIGGSGAGFTAIRFTGDSLTLFIYLAALSAVAFVLWNTLMIYNSVGKISMYYFLIPVFGVLQSSLYLSEPLYPIVFVSLFLVIAGIMIVNQNMNKLYKTITQIRKYLYSRQKKPINKIS